MKRKSNKLVCLLLTAIMLIGLLPTSVISFAAGEAQTKVVYDLDGVSGSPHVSFLEYGNPHHNWKFFDFCDDLWDIYETGNTPSYATDVDANGLQAKRVQSSMLYATKNARLRFLVGDYGKAIVNDGWFALRLKAPSERGIYKMSFTVPSTDVYASKNVNVWVAPYEEGKNDGADYMTAENLVLSNQSFATAGSVITVDGIVNSNVSEYVVIFRLNGRGSSSNWEFHLSEIALEKTESMPYLLDLSKFDEVAGAPAGHKAYVLPGFEMYGVQYANLIAKSGADNSEFDMYFAEYFGGDASGYVNAENLVAEDITYSDGEAFIDEAFTVLNNTKHILIVGESVDKVEYDKVRDVAYVYDLDGAGGNPHTAFLEYGNPHANWKFFDLCDDFWTILDGGKPASAAEATDAEIQYIKARMFSASKNAYLRIVAGDYNKFTLNNAWAAIKVKAPVERGIYDVNIKIPASGSYGKNVSIWVAPYVKGEDDGEYYMTDDNLVINGQSLSSASGPVVTGHGAVSDGSEELVVIFRLNGQGRTSNFELHMNELSLVKTAELKKEYIYEINADETVVESPENFGIYEIELSAESGEDLSDVVAYLAPNGTSDYKTEANKIVSAANGTKFVGEKLFSAIKGAEKL
ncbi:MAG: hypothetical protein IIV97_00595, partial [Oscillospiraceae bacterium]|nr:hypothetical protein [Oscillospiraceae bacterium]